MKKKIKSQGGSVRLDGHHRYEFKWYEMLGPSFDPNFLISEILQVLPMVHG